MSPHDDHHKHHESLSEFIEHEEHKAIRIIKKISLGLIGVFLLLLIVSLSLPQSTMESLIASMTGMPNGDQVVIELDQESRILMQTQVYDRLLDAYYQEQEKEIKACLTGSRKGTEYLVEGIYFPTIHSHAYNRVQAELCDKHTIIDMHTHPYRSCLFSEVDVKAHKTVRQINPDALMGLMCGPNRFNIYGHNV